MDPQIVARGFGFATYPAVKLKVEQENSSGKKVMKFAKELLFGDYIEIKKDKNGNAKVMKRGRDTYVLVKCRAKEGWIKTREIQKERILEVNFVDVGQGDGVHLVTPDDNHFLIDAGKSDNMYRFIKWRFNLGRSNATSPPFHAVVTHSDNDHYGGFSKLFTSLLNFQKIYHNGMVEESGKEIETLGTIKNSRGKNYVTDLVDTQAQFTRRVNSMTKKGQYANTMTKSNTHKEALWKRSAPLHKFGNMQIDVLGPIRKTISGKKALPVFNIGNTPNKGKTKNGHSIILLLTIGNLRVLLGGDLNSQAEGYLFKELTGTDMETATAAQKKQAIKALNKKMGVDIAKSCHHGSPDFMSEFMEALNPIATIISSGDQESHSHPRPDTLGAIGKTGRGERPLIFSTELSRSTKEMINLSDLSPTKKKQRVVTVYGMINVRTDGNKVIIAQKLEKSSGSKNWDIHKLEWDSSAKEFKYKSKYLK